MAFIKHDATNTLSPRGSHSATIARVTIGNGAFRLNKPAIELMKLRPSDKIAILIDDKDKTEWALTVDKDGFSMNPTYWKKGFGFVSSSVLAKRLMESFQVPASWRVRFDLRKDGDIYHLLNKQVFQPKTK